MKPILKITLIALLLGVTATRSQAYENDCCNDCQPTPSPSCPATGANPIHPGMANLHRQVTDLETYGAAPIKFTRIFNSRATNFNDPYWDFGARQTWQHNWNFEMRQLTTKSFNQFDIKVRYPNGVEYNFKAPDATSNQRVPPADHGDRLYKWSGTTVGYTLITPNGEEYDFHRYLSPKFHLTAMRDGQGISWTFTYDPDTKLKRISNPFGRWIEIERSVVNGVASISRIFSNDGREVTYTYSPWQPTGTILLTSVNYPGGEQARYTWVTSDPTASTARPVLETASDPLYPGAGARTRYVYNYESKFDYGAGPYLVSGMVKVERNLDQNSDVLVLPSGGGHYPQILEGNGTEITRKFQNGLLTESGDGENRANFYTYSAAGFGYLETQTEPNGAVTTFSRDYAGRTLSQTDSLGNTRSYTYNTAGFEISRTDERGNTTATTRDDANRPVRTDYPEASYETWTYNSYGQQLTHRERKGGTNSFVYYNGTEVGGKLGDLKTSTDALGHITTFTYTDSGLRSSLKDARNNTTSSTYNWRGQLETDVHPDGSFTRSEYDGFGNRTRQIDELGHAWIYTYDEFNHVASKTDPLGRVTTFEYGREPGCATCTYAETLTRINLPSGKKIEYQYDKSWKKTAQIVGAGTGEAATTRYEYTPDGHMTALTDPRGKRTLFTYDLRGRRTSVTDPLGHKTESTYDGAGNKLSEKRPDNGTTSFVYDAMNRLKETTDPKNQVTKFEYDGGNNRTKLTDPRDNSYLFEYDAGNQKAKMVYPDQSFEQWTYDTVGNSLTYTTRAGQVQTRTYDNRNRRTSANWDDATPDVTSTYDAAGRLLTLTNSVSSLTFTYDIANQLASETQQIMPDGGSKSITYSYDSDGNRSGLVYPSGGNVTYGYTGRNQIAAITVDGPPPMATYSYDLAGNRSGKTLENETNASYVYDDANRLLTIDHQKSGVSFAKFDYEYNSVNNRTARTQANPGGGTKKDSYSYDAADQITEVKYNVNAGGNTQDRLVDYNHDAVGNRTAVTENGAVTNYGTANSLNQFATGSLGLPYDGNGNLAGNAGWNYTYDAQNRLTTASGNGVSMTFAYDSRNRCVKRTLGGTATYLYYDAWNVIEEHDFSGIQARYVHGARVDELLARVSGASTVFYHHDALGSTAALTDSGGQVLERYTYDVFGAPTFRNASDATIAETAFGNRSLFTGRGWIRDISAYDYRNRVYSPSLGRFLQTDPVRLKGKDVNLYRYVANSPINKNDPFGLFTIGEKECTEQDWTEGNQECKQKGWNWVIQSCHWIKLGVRIGPLECGVWTRVVICDDTSN